MLSTLTQRDLTSPSKRAALDNDGNTTRLSNKVFLLIEETWDPSDQRIVLVTVQKVCKTFFDACRWQEKCKEGIRELGLGGVGEYQYTFRIEEKEVEA